MIVWKASRNGQDFKPIQTCTDHAGAINCITVLRIEPTSQRWLVATGSADASIKTWILENDELKLLQTIKTAPKYFPLCLSLSHLGDDSDAFVLAAAGTRDTVQIFTAEAKSDTIQFEVQATLTGHEGWIRSLSFVRETSASGSDYLLASASQDKYIRIWRLHQGKELPTLLNQDADSDPYLPGKSPSNKAYRLKSAGKDFSVTFEALLLGHEDWIYSARWFKHGEGSLQLLSTSADNSLAIRPLASGSAWRDWVRSAGKRAPPRLREAQAVSGPVSGLLMASQ